MNNSIIPYEEYRELLKKQQVLNFKIMIITFLVSGLILLGLGLGAHFIDNDEEWIFMLIPSGVMIFIFFIGMFGLKSYNSKLYNPFNFQQYQAYEAKGTKVPMYRMVSNGKSNQTIHMLLDISDGMYRMYDIRKKELKPYFEASISNTYVKFFYKEKNGLEIIKTRVQFFVDSKKYNLYGDIAVNSLFLSYLKNEGLRYEVQIGRNKSRY